MMRKARAGHVTGGRVYGYDNIEILSGLLDAYGRPKRDHVERRVNQEQAAVVRRIFMLCAAGKGMVSIAQLLNDEKDARHRAIVRAGGYCGLGTHTSMA